MLKKLTLLTIIIFSFTITTNAQLPISLEIYGGVAGSSFEDQPDISFESATGVVLGGAVLIDIIPIIDAGVEFNTLVSPFSYEIEGFDQTATIDISQTWIGAFGSLDILPLVAVTGYVKAGVGMVSGKLKGEGGGESQEVDFKSSVGFYGGVGLKTMIGLYGEFRYNFVSRELDIEGAPSFGYNNWMLVAGYRFSL